MGWFTFAFLTIAGSATNRFRFFFPVLRLPQYSSFNAQAFMSGPQDPVLNRIPHSRCAFNKTQNSGNRGLDAVAKPNLLTANFFAIAKNSRLKAEKSLLRFFLSTRRKTQPALE